MVKYRRCTPITSDYSEVSNIKRKRKVVTIEQKIEILNELSRGVSVMILSERYSIGKSSVSNIKNKKTMLNFINKSY